MKVFVTGSSGFTGRYLCQALTNQDFEVYGFDDDILDLGKLEERIAAIKPDYVIHLAAISFVAEKDQSRFHLVNVTGTENLLKAIAHNAPEIKKIIIASSANIYGNALEQPIKEDCPPAPQNEYAKSKLAMEKMLHQWFDKLPILITRPFNYTGPGQAEKFLVPKLMQHFIDKKQQIDLGNIQVTRDISDINFIVECYLRLLKSDAVSQCVNLCSGTPYSIASIINEIERHAGYEITINIDERFIRPNEIKSLTGCNQRLKSLIGELQSTPLNHTIASWWRNLSTSRGQTL